MKWKWKMRSLESMHYVHIHLRSLLLDISKTLYIKPRKKPSVFLERILFQSELVYDQSDIFDSFMFMLHTYTQAYIKTLYMYILNNIFCALVAHVTLYITHRAMYKCIILVKFMILCSSNCNFNYPWIRFLSYLSRTRAAKRFSNI
jgi:hypothetical protein